MEENSKLTTSLSPLEQTVYEAVEEIQGIKHDTGRHPDFAMISEINNFLQPELPVGFEDDVLKALRALYSRGRIEYRLTVNRVPMFGIKQR